MANEIDYNSPEYKAWRFAILSRDGFKCCLDNTTDELEIHHIKPWAKFEKLRFINSNGITLCKRCHEMVTGNEASYEKQFKEIVSENMKKKYGFVHKKKKKYRQQNSRMRF